MAMALVVCVVRIVVNKRMGVGARVVGTDESKKSRSCDYDAPARFPTHLLTPDCRGRNRPL
jgi:hypothetical protein